MSDYDITENFLKWRPTGERLTRDNPRRAFYEFWKPRLVYPAVYEKVVDGETLKVAILMSHGIIYYAESLDDV